MSFNTIFEWLSLNSKLLLGATWETIYMVAVAGVVGFAVGIPLGVILHITKKGGLLENTKLNGILGAVVNVGRSVPFLVLMVAIIPVTKMLVGTFIGTTAAIVPLTIGAIPFVARLIEGHCWKYQLAWLRLRNPWAQHQRKSSQKFSYQKQCRLLLTQ